MKKTLFKTSALGLLGLVILASGCTHTQHVSEEPPADIDFHALNDVLEGRRVEIQRRDQRTIPSTALLIKPDTTWAIDLLSGRVQGMATHEVEAVTWRRPGRGVLEGAVWGSAVGAVVGFGAGLALTSVRDAEKAQTSIEAYVAMISGFGVLLGAGSGMFIGMSRGRRDQYVYPQVLQGAWVDPSEEATGAEGAPRRALDSGQ